MVCVTVLVSLRFEDEVRGRGSKMIYEDEVRGRGLRTRFGNKMRGRGSSTRTTTPARWKKEVRGLAHNRIKIR